MTKHASQFRRGVRLRVTNKATPSLERLRMALPSQGGALMSRQNSSHFALRQGNRRGEWATACGQSVREKSLCSLDTADWIVCPECRAAAVAARDAMAEENAGDPDITSRPLWP
jgi:hypothetical protein